jgi:hypothetical protein
MPIFDQGYQHWKGPLAGHGWRWLAVTRHGVRALWKNNLLRLLVVSAWIPALGLASVLALWGLLEQRAESITSWLGAALDPRMIQDPRNYRVAVWTIAFSFFFKAELFATLVMVLFVGPNLISRDLRFNALPLYFARPLRRIDYFLGKLGVIGFFLATVAIIPAMAAYVLGVCFSMDLRVVPDTFRLVWASLLYGAVIVVSGGTLMLALSSLSRRSVYAGLLWAGLWLVSSWISWTLVAVQTESILWRTQETEIARWIEAHPPPPGIRLQQGYPVYRRRPRFAQIGPPPPETEADRYLQDYQEASNRAWQRAALAGQEARRGDWRPLCAYPNNLDRIGDHFLGTDAAYRSFAHLSQNPEQVTAFTWQYPWQWSAGVLLGLLGLSVWILSFRVKSLDRLR